MPLDVAQQRSRSTTAELHYLIRTGEKPARYTMEPPPGVPQWNGVDDPHTVLIEDARGREAEFTLDRNGFTLVKSPTAIRNFYDPAEIKSVYYPEVERLLLENLGASRVVVFDHNVRNGARSDLPQPSRRVHNDHTVNSAPRRVRDHLGADAEALLQHRFGIVNVWRPIRGPVLDSPLALCDARTFTDDDLIASDLVYPHVRGETSSVEFKPGHRWYYFSEQQTDEVILIRVHDSATDGRARLSFHTSFENPLAPADAPPRESIEVRALVFFPPNT
ncbi:MAG: methyltransferase [Proteobacteria bacterium]|nr:methyltransferase [Pseudomonadota bacterium]